MFPQGQEDQVIRVNSSPEIRSNRTKTDNVIKQSIVHVTSRETIAKRREEKRQILDKKKRVIHTRQRFHYS